MRAKFVNEIKRGESYNSLSVAGIGRAGIERKIKDWLSSYNIVDYTIDKDLKISVFNDVTIQDVGLIEFPDYINFKTIHGDFDVSECDLNTLRGVPTEVIGNFACQFNNLTDLTHAPNHITGNVHCNNNKLISLAGSIDLIEGNFYCKNNFLTSLDGGPRVVNGKYDCSYNHIKSLKGCPKDLNSLICNNNKIENFDDGPVAIAEDLVCYNNPIKESDESICKRFFLTKKQDGWFIGENFG